jgi:hypothetical protein
MTWDPENGRKRISRWFGQLGCVELARWVFRCSYSLSHDGRWPCRVWSYILTRTYDGLVLGIGAIGGSIADAHIELRILRHQ